MKNKKTKDGKNSKKRKAAQNLKEEDSSSTHSLPPARQRGGGGGGGKGASGSGLDRRQGTGIDEIRSLVGAEIQQAVSQAAKEAAIQTAHLVREACGVNPHDGTASSGKAGSSADAAREPSAPTAPKPIAAAKEEPTKGKDKLNEILPTKSRFQKGMDVRIDERKAREALVAGLEVTVRLETPPAADKWCKNLAGKVKVADLDAEMAAHGFDASGLNKGEKVLGLLQHLRNGKLAL